MFFKTGVLKISQYSQENNCVGDSFYLKRDSNTRVSCEYCDIFKNTLKAFDDFKNKQKSV